MTFPGEEGDSLKGGCGPLAAFLLLAFVRKKALHYLLPGALIVVYLVLNWGETFD
jgi:hypothetical protein